LSTKWGELGLPIVSWLPAAVTSGSSRTNLQTSRVRARHQAERQPSSAQDLVPESGSLRHSTHAALWGHPFFIRQSAVWHFPNMASHEKVRHFRGASHHSISALESVGIGHLQTA
jgi:hypothetical protein